MMKAEDYGYVVKNNLCLFQKGPLSQWWGGFKGQNGGFTVGYLELYYLFTGDNFDVFRYLEKNHSKDRITFNCCEQWMMASKAVLFNDIETFEKIIKEFSPSKQKDLGRSVSNYDQDLWNEFKYNIVFLGNEHKFHQNEDLRDFLTSFNPFTIFAEAAPWDKVWGIGLGPNDPKALDIRTWEGENLLGKVIITLRQVYGFEQ